MNAVSGIVSGTPAWVWLLLVFLILRGVQAMKTGVVLFWRLLIIPAIFTLMGLYGVAGTLHLGWFSAGTWIAAIAVGCYLGGLLVRHVTIRADRSRGLVELPGSPFTLILILLIFASKYALGYQLATDPASAASSQFIFLDAGVSGLVVGLFAGRLSGYYKKYRSAADVDLSPAGAPRSNQA